MTRPLSPMSSERHHAIRSLLVAEAAARRPEPTSPASAGLLKRPTPRRVAVLALCTTPVAVIATALVVSGPATSPAFASWTAVPETAPAAIPSPQDLEAWASQCSDLTDAGVSIEGVPARPLEADQRDVLVDRRGEYTYCVDVSEGTGTASDPLIALAGIRGPDVQQTSATVYDKPINQPVGSEVLLIGGGRPPSRSGNRHARPLGSLPDEQVRLS